MLNIYSYQKDDLRTLKNISGLHPDNIDFHIIEDASRSDCGHLLKKEKEEIFLDNLREGDYMFMACSGVKIINCYAPKLINAPHMFAQEWEVEATTYSSSPFQEFYGDLPLLKNGENMFYASNLKEFRGDLSSLENGYHMFSRSRYYTAEERGPQYVPDLSPTSVLTIVETIPTYTDGSSHIINISIQIDDTTEAKDAFAKEALFDSWEELNTEFSNKGWTVQWELGKVTSNTLEANEDTVPTKWYVKLTEIKTNPIMKKYAEKQNKRYIPSKANYCTEDGEKFYKLEWCNDSNNLEGYQEFGSLLEACGYFGVIPVKYLEEN